MIFYFSVTGNTLHVAMSLDPDAISIPQAMKSPDLHFKADKIGSVGGRSETVWADFDFTDDCIGCEICTRVCLAGCIHLENGHAVRTGENCQTCFAYVHACPKMAIMMNQTWATKILPTSKIPQRERDASGYNQG